MIVGLKRLFYKIVSKCEEVVSIFDVVDNCESGQQHQFYFKDKVKLSFKTKFLFVK